MTLPPFQTVSTGAVVAIVGFFSSFPIVLQGLTGVGASPQQAAAGLMAAALAMALAGAVLSMAYRMPISAAWSTPGVALLAVTAPVEGGFAVAVGGFLLAGVLTVVAGFWRPLARFAADIPAPLAQAMLAGVLVSLCIAPFEALAEAPRAALPIILTWFLVGRVNKLFAVPAAVVAAGGVTFLWGDLSILSESAVLTAPLFILPEFTFQGAISIGLPLFVVTMAAQNIPGIAVLRSFGYTPSPGGQIAGVGIVSVLGAPFGAPQTCLAAITAAMCAGDDACADAARRYWAAVMAALFYAVFGLFAALITALAAAAPPMVLETLAGIALMGVFANSAQAALHEVSSREAAAVTFLITASGASVAGIGAPVWGLAVGGLVYMCTARARRGA
ncbi:benzoate/H(+) symporter BenE family transporter [Aliiroseovarius sp.]|uniref:benzoate/H(+) symporter BenE family transporter n=1 Tax=Aliiroseovarius sp. TaxID=1872442 RepID=UPI003BADAC28